MTQLDDMRRAIREADPQLSRFDPLRRIICLDDFDRGMCGWTQLVGNYEITLDQMLPSYAQHTHAQLSTLPNWDFGSHGGVDGSYALKLATRAKRGAQNVTLKRLTFRKAGPIRMECYFTFKPEASELQLMETDVRSFGFLYDLQVGDQHGAGGQRVMPHLRFLNAEDGKHLQKWQFNARPPTSCRSHCRQALSRADRLGGPAGREQRLLQRDPDQDQLALPALIFDLATMKATDFQVNDRSFDMSTYDPIRIPAMKNLWHAQPCARRDRHRQRAFAYLDSVCLSGIDAWRIHRHRPQRDLTGLPRPSLRVRLGPEAIARARARPGWPAADGAHDPADACTGRRGRSLRPRWRMPSPSSASRISALSCASPQRCRRAPRSRCWSVCI